MRYLILRMIRTDEVIGILSVPKGTYVHVTWHRPSGLVHVEPITQPEFTTYKAFDFTQFHWYRGRLDRGEVIAFDPKIFKLKIQKNGERKVVEIE